MSPLLSPRGSTPVRKPALRRLAVGVALSLVLPLSAVAASTSFAAPQPAAAKADAPAAAATAGAPDAAAKAAPGGAEALAKYKEEPVPGGALLLAAYMVMWALAAALVARVVMRQSRTEAELKELAERVDVATETQA